MEALPTQLVRQRGGALISESLLNKGTSFTDEERDELGLRGLLPARVTTIDEQVALELEHIRRKSDELEQFIGLAALQDRNETLFYRVLADNLEEFLPIVYTPTVGRACQEFSHIFRRPRGLWITPEDVDRMDEILGGAGHAVRLIVVTDNERILGLGDQGAGGIAIPVGKLALYTVAAGIHPSRTLPISLDVGTDRQDLLNDPLYLGYRQRRLRGEEYDEVVESFVDAVKRVFPSAVVQWEDFKQHNALRILSRYRHRLPSFNDDVQGTGAVVLAGLLAARRNSRSLLDDRFMLLGAGAAGIGIASMIERQLAADLAARAPRTGESAPHLLMIDSAGLIHSGRNDVHTDQRPFEVDPAWLATAGVTGEQSCDPIAIARAFQPTVLIGTTGQRGLFSRELVEAVATSCAEPIILPLSNPTDRAEATAADLLEWTGGRALVATGSPSAELAWDGTTRPIGQANNAFIFPGVGLGAIVAQARAIPDDVFVVAAQALSRLVTDERLALGALYPPVAEMRRAARSIAIATATYMRDCGYGRQLHDDEIAAEVDDEMWRPEYAVFKPA
jgi:malic enzyme